MTAERTVMLVKKRTYFGAFAYMNSACIRKGVTFMLLSSLSGKSTLLYQNSVTDVSVSFLSVSI